MRPALPATIRGRVALATFVVLLGVLAVSAAMLDELVEHAARRDLDNREPLRLQAQDAAFRHVGHILPLAACPAPAESHLLDPGHELADLAFPLDAHRTVL